MVCEMRVLIFSGSHPRHTYVHQEVLLSGAECAAVVMEREALIPNPPNNITDHDVNNFIRHFNERDIVEQSIFGTTVPQDIFCDVPTFYCQPETLNSDATVNFVKEFDPELVIIFGVDLIKDPLLGVLPKDKLNLHLGLSPWYRGSATLFWPFYFMQPQYAGVTFHQIVPEADAGDIVHQSVPELINGDGIHDVGARAVVQARIDLSKLLDIYFSKHRWVMSSQRSSGRLFLTKDFEPHHLRVIYDVFENNLVEHYLSGNIPGKLPMLICHKGV
jgi:methionyl-tRNA formyltransferase